MNIEERIFRKDTINKYNNKINTLGPTSKITTTNFLMSRLFIELLLIIVCLFIPKYGLLIGLIITIIFHFGYEYLLIDNSIKIRNNNLYDESLIFFRMLKLSLKSTNDLMKSLNIVSSKCVDNSFAIDFNKLLMKNNYNDDLNKVFKDMQDKIANKDIIIALIDLSKTNDYEKTLNNIIANLEEKNNILNKEKYSKLPFTLTILSLIFIISFIIIVIKLEYILSFFS